MGITCTRVPSLTTMRCGRSPAGAGLGGDVRQRAAFAQAGPRALQRALEALRAEGLEQVVHGVGVEGAHGVLVVGGDEDDHRRLRGFDQFQHFEAIQLGHLDVEEEQVRAGFGDGLDGLEAVGAFGHDHEFPGARPAIRADIRGPVPRHPRGRPSMYDRSHFAPLFVVSRSYQINCFRRVSFVRE